MLYETDINSKISELEKQVEELHSHIMHINSEINYIKGILTASNYLAEHDEGERIDYGIDTKAEEVAQPVEVTPHRNYKYLSDYWCECGNYIGKKGSVTFCSDCGRKVKWDE